MFEHKMRQRKRGKQHGDGRSKEPADVGFEDSTSSKKRHRQAFLASMAANS
jgi:hypothetical protein